MLADGYAAAGVLTKGNISVSGGLNLGGIGLVLPWLPAALPAARAPLRRPTRRRSEHR